MAYTRWTKEMLEPIVASSKSYAECLRKMDRKEVGGNYKNLQKNIDKFKLDTSHMTYQSWNAGMEFVPLEELKKPTCIKNRIIKELGPQCQECGRMEWNDKPIPLELEHIDGNNRNNTRENLTLLCCNCHALTPTWRRRNKNIGKQKVTDEQLIKAKNIRQALIKAPKGRNYNRVSKILDVKKVDFNNSQYGTIWINNGASNKKIKKDELEDYTDNGYVKGRINCNPPSIKGKIWVTNGICNKIVLQDQIPTGFWKGKIQKKNS